MIATLLLAAPGLACDGHNGVRAIVDPLPPDLAGVQVELHTTMGAQLVLANRGGRTVEVLDDAGDAFVRIGPRGVEGNVATPSWYATYSPAAVVPASANAGAPARWLRAGSVPAFGWFEPRVDAARVAVPEHIRRGGVGADIGSWRIALRIDEMASALTGRFRFEPPRDGAFVSRLISSTSPEPGVRLMLLPGPTPGLMVHNRAPQSLLVLGAAGEPFLRIGPQGVEANLRSPTWRASGRAVGATPPTGDVDPRLPEWQRVASVPRYSWIEPRAGSPSGATAGAVTRWRVPMQLGDKPIDVSGEVAWRAAGGSAPM